MGGWRQLVSVEIPSLPVQVFRGQKKLLQWSCSSRGGADCQISHNATLAAHPSAIAGPPTPPAACLMTRFNSCCQTWRRSQCRRVVLVTASVRASTGSGCKNWCHSIRHAVTAVTAWLLVASSGCCGNFSILLPHILPRAL